MEKKYTIGLDYGSLSGRAVLADTCDWMIAAEAVMEHPHGIMDSLPLDGSPLKGQWGLQNPCLLYTSHTDYKIASVVKVHDCRAHSFFVGLKSLIRKAILGKWKLSGR